MSNRGLFRAAGGEDAGQAAGGKSRNRLLPFSRFVTPKKILVVLAVVIFLSATTAAKPLIPSVTEVRGLLPCFCSVWCQPRPLDALQAGRITACLCTCFPASVCCLSTARRWRQLIPNIKRVPGSFNGGILFFRSCEPKAMFGSENLTVVRLLESRFLSLVSRAMCCFVVACDDRKRRIFLSKSAPWSVPTAILSRPYMKAWRLRISYALVLWLGASLKQFVANQSHSASFSLISLCACPSCLCRRLSSKGADVEVHAATGWKAEHGYRRWHQSSTEWENVLPHGRETSERRFVLGGRRGGRGWGGGYNSNEYKRFVVRHVEPRLAPRLGGLHRSHPSECRCTRVAREISVAYLIMLSCAKYFDRPSPSAATTEQ